MGNIFEKYTQIYPVSKTLRFSLIPMYETEENIRRYGILENDRLKAEEYIKVKEIFDRCHKVYIGKRLENMTVDRERLYSVFVESRKEKTAVFEKESEEYRKEISRFLTYGEEYGQLKPEAIIKSVVKGEDTPVILTEEEKESVRLFNRFSTYFSHYHTSRENIYGVKKNSVAYRLINENFPRFAENIKIFKELDPETAERAEQQLAPVLNGRKLKEIFTPEFYSSVLTQEGIEFYNSVIGGRTVSETERLSGFNEFLYSEYQRGNIRYRISMFTLYRQILSDRGNIYPASAGFDSDAEVLESLFDFGTAVNSVIDENIDGIKQIFSSGETDSSKIYIRKNGISVLSSILYDGKWNRLWTKLKEKGIKEEKTYTLSTLEEVTLTDISGEILPVLLGQFSAVKNSFFRLHRLFGRDKIDSYADIKMYLDSVKACENVLKIFDVPFDMERDTVFYPVYDTVYGTLRNNVPVYNRVRNYAVRKPYSERKYRLNFETPILANGWDRNQEYTNNTMIFIKDGLYYVAVLNAKNKKRIKENSEYTEGSYRKMVYKLLPSPEKMLPKVFFSAKWLKEHEADSSITEGYRQGLHKKGKNFDMDFCHRLTDYFKECINQHEDWSKFGFKFSETETYRNMGEFYSEIAAQNYRITFSYVEETEIRQHVAEGNMFLFQLYSKDFSAAAKGKPNLHTMYWKEIFSEENIIEPVYRLNGNAELYYRPASVGNPFAHRKGSILVSKTDRYMKPVESSVYRKALKDAGKGMEISELEKKYPQLCFRYADYDITKDRRYSKRSYSFHVPITVNNNCSDKSSQLNGMVLEDISADRDVNIIGIARGERNLVYAVVINQKGEILCQKSFNEIRSGNSNVDYHKKLEQAERTRDDERKNWKKISGIKSIKEGYLSAVIKETADMMIKYNAVVVLEDLDAEFKNRRVKIEKQIYQKFEKMLADKLSFFADKGIPKDEIGGIRRGYQLTGRTEGLSRSVKQSGFMFYVPAAYSSAIDPLTGFVNLFTHRQLTYQSVEAAKDFFGKFSEVAYDKEFRCFRFTFRYSDFDISAKDYTDCWTVYSCGKGRIVHTKKNGIDRAEKTDVTEQLDKLFREYGIDITEKSVLNRMMDIDRKDFWERLLYLFRTVVQLRYEDEKEYFILSPVHRDGRFFDGRRPETSEPENVDANGAYHIALQGLRIIQKRIKDGKIIPDGTGRQIYNWLEFVQKKEYMG